MKRKIICIVCAMMIIIPSASYAASVAVGWGVTGFQEDLDSVDTGPGLSLEAIFGSGSVGLILAGLWSSHDSSIDYQSYMAGPVWSVGNVRIYAGVSRHDVTNAGAIKDGWGVTVGGGAGWKLASLPSFLFDVRISDWEGNNNTNIRTGSLQLMFQLGF